MKKFLTIITMAVICLAALSCERDVYLMNTEPIIKELVTDDFTIVLTETVGTETPSYQVYEVFTRYEKELADKCAEIECATKLFDSLVVTKDKEKLLNVEKDLSELREAYSVKYQEIECLKELKDSLEQNQIKDGNCIVMRETTFKVGHGDNSYTSVIFTRHLFDGTVIAYKELGGEWKILCPWYQIPVKEPYNSNINWYKPDSSYEPKTKYPTLMTTEELLPPLSDEE